MTDLSTLQRAAKAWLAHDPDPTSRARIETMLRDGDHDALELSFATRVEFGTAGLRGPLIPGPGGLNLAVVRGVAHALGRWVGSGSAVIGFDGRHGSREFAAESASIFGGLGLDVFLFDEVCPTPELAHAVKALGATFGVMVTASHNPPGDNGYKVYDATATQILPDAADAIAALWDEQPHPAAGPSVDELRQAGTVRQVPEEVGEAWLSGLLSLRVHPDPAPLSVVYTALHGVGTKRLLEIMAKGGHHGVYPVPEQAQPDGDFPTVTFPNPEEPGSMDLSMAAARERGADLVIANDPDADRLAIAVPDRKGGWRQLSGDEVGWLLAEDLLSQPRPAEPQVMVATTIVSSGLLARIASHHGARYAETLTGFKWIGGAALAYDEAGGHFLFGYEESCGYLAGSQIRDKDGIGAALLFADLAADCKRAGESVLDRLDALHRRHGLHSGGSHSVRLSGADAQDRLAGAMTRLRADPPTELGGRKVTRIKDVLTGEDRDLSTGKVGTVELPSSNLLAYDLEGGRALVRPSGTEPKLKLYYEVVLPLGERSIEEVQATVAPALDAILQSLLQAVGL